MTRYLPREPLAEIVCSASTLGSELSRPPSATPGSPVTSKRTILLGKSNGLNKGTRERKSSRISAAASTSSVRVCVPYWNEACQENSSRLWLPTATGLPDLESNSSVGYSNATVAKSWFSANLQKAVHPRNSLKTCLPFSVSSPPACTDSANIVI